jgi:NADPH:quinone reductase-like Zn-dependent oxidoreductase
MKAVVYTEYGSPDVLHLKEVEKPTPKDNEVLVKVYAASANPLDWRTMRGEPFLVRLDNGFRKPKTTILGADIAGRVVAVGRNVTQFKPGDAVFGETSANGLGGFAEYVAVPENAVVLKPETVSFEDAASTPVVGFTAIQGLRNVGNIRAGQKVLINGASGGIGTFAVQYAKANGAEVTGVCSTRNLDMVRSIGADHVIDYTQEDFSRSGQKYDLIYDAIGNRSVGDYKRALTPNGQCVIAGFTTLPRLFSHILLGMWVSKTGRQKVGLMGSAQTSSKDLQLIAELLETRKVVPVIDRCYPLSETAEAIRYLETMRARGKVIIQVAENAS